MEPPAKRLRLLGSIDVDDTNPDYIAAKQKQQQRFKSALESLFAKYGDMHESQSDEVDIRDGHIVVDRGHLRRLHRQVSREETSLLDRIGMGTKGVPEDEEEEEEEEEDEADSEDELAPTQPAKSESARKAKDQQQTIAVRGTAQPPSNNNQLQIRQLLPVSSAPVQPPIAPNPAANLLQFVQFPQTPAGQQAQMSFCATLTQTINHAVQQAVAPLFSGLLPNTPGLQLPLSSALSASTTTPARTLDKMAPATDPKWYFPPLPEQSRKPEAARSSRITASANSPTTRCRTIQQEPTPSVPAPLDLQKNTIPVAAVVGPKGKTNHDGSKRVLRRLSPKVEIKSQRGHRSSTYTFTEEDDIQIAKLRVLHGRSWTAIRDSEQKWTTWPLWTFQQRWYKRLKGRNLHLQECTTLRDTHNGPGYSRQETVTLPAHQLPTPSVSEQEDSRASVFDASIGTIENIMSSSTHFDDDERELLSLAGEEIDDAQSVCDNVENETLPGADEMVLPSVELTGSIDEDTLQQHLLEASPMGDAAATPVRIKQELPYSSPSKKQKRTQKPISYQAIPDSHTEAEGGDTGSAPPRPEEQSSFLCDICKATFQNVDNLDQHRTNVHTSRRQIRPKSASLDLVGDDDELQTATPTTAHIKREFSTPPPTGFLVSTPLGQMRSYADLPPSRVQSASGLSRRAYLKQVKQSWAKRSSPAPKSMPRRKTFHTMLGKRAWAGDAESEDELGL